MTLAWIAHTFGHQRATVVLQDSAKWPICTFIFIKVSTSYPKSSPKKDTELLKTVDEVAVSRFALVNANSCQRSLSARA